jgi:hypothetical protein
VQLLVRARPQKLAFLRHTILPGRRTKQDQPSPPAILLDRRVIRKPPHRGNLHPRAGDADAKMKEPRPTMGLLVNLRAQEFGQFVFYKHHLK